ncbi:hypothetical protein LguiA_017759 [Lonicera macranthoides]
MVSVMWEMNARKDGVVMWVSDWENLPKMKKIPEMKKIEGKGQLDQSPYPPQQRQCIGYSANLSSSNPYPAQLHQYQVILHQKRERYRTPTAEQLDTIPVQKKFGMWVPPISKNNGRWAKNKIILARCYNVSKRKSSPRKIRDSLFKKIEVLSSLCEVKIDVVVTLTTNRINHLLSHPEKLLKRG